MPPCGQAATWQLGDHAGRITRLALLTRPIMGTLSPLLGHLDALSSQPAGPRHLYSSCSSCPALLISSRPVQEYEEEDDDQEEQDDSPSPPVPTKRGRSTSQAASEAAAPAPKESKRRRRSPPSGSQEQAPVVTDLRELLSGRRSRGSGMPCSCCPGLLCHAVDLWRAQAVGVAFAQLAAE